MIVDTYIQYVPEASGKRNIIQTDSITEKRSDLLRGEASYTAPDFSNKESELRMLLGEYDELVNITADIIDPSFHSRYSITLPLKTYPLSPNSPKEHMSHSRRASSM